MPGLRSFPNRRTDFGQQRFEAEHKVNMAACQEQGLSEKDTKFIISDSHFIGQIRTFLRGFLVDREHPFPYASCNIEADPFGL